MATRQTKQLIKDFFNKKIKKQKKTEIDWVKVEKAIEEELARRKGIEL